jgi:phospholipid/cholesterol/gamma-HCH transport system substrate-binding protein
MKNMKSTEFKVGLTVIISTAILIFGIIWGKGFKLEPDKNKITVQFENVGGMVVGDPVTVNGVKEGKVAEIVSQDRMVITTLEVSDHIQLYEDADFVVVSAELLAGMRVEIWPGKSDQHINLARQPFKGRYGGRIVDVGLTIDKLAVDMSALTFRLDTTAVLINKFLQEGQLQKNINATLANLDNISGSLKNLLNENSGELSEVIKNLASGSDKFKTLMENNENSINSTLQNINQISTRLDTVSLSLQAVMNQIHSKNSTLGKMIYDTTLYNNLTKTLASIDSLSVQIKNEGLDIDLF